MTEVKGSPMAGGSLLAPVDWTYPAASVFDPKKDFLHQGPPFQDYDDGDDDDDDLDSYYMEVTPIDMTERLKEVNRALAEDSTPVDAHRVTKLRFKEVIAEYQSLRDSDSDDGYGDSSEIMFDAEDENDIIEGSDVDSGSGDKGRSGSDCRLKPTEEEIEELESRFQEKTFSLNDAGSKVGSWLASVSETEPKSILAPSVAEELSSSDEEIPEEDIVEEIVEEKVSVSTLSPVGGRNGENSFRRSSSPSESQITGDYEDDDVFEAEEICEEIQTGAKEDIKSPTEDDRSANSSRRTSNDSIIRIDVSDNSTLKDRNKDSSRVLDITDLEFENNIPDDVDIKEQEVITRDLNNKGTNDSTFPNNKSESCVVERKPVTQDTHKKNLSSKSEDKENSSKAKKNNNKSDFTNYQQVPAIKPSLSPYNVSSSVIKDSRNKRKSSKMSSTTNEAKCNRPRLNALNTNPVPVQNTRSFREVRARRGSPIPQRTSKTPDKKPMKAIHSESLSNITQPKKEWSSSRPKSCPSSQNRVRKAASTSDLCRSSSEDQDKINEVVYEKWLQQKNRQAAIARRKMEEARAADKEAASAKLEERKRLAEEAFQQWLRRKREQLKMEKKLKRQQRKLDQQTNYARTRVQCEEAYKEWCQRKNEEINARKGAGVSGSSGVRSRSLERTWIQEKTRKLYNAYLSK